MPTLYYATTNLGKIQSLQRELDPVGVTVQQVNIEIPEIRSDDGDVDEIAREKVKYAYQQVQAPVVALDAGFYIHSISGFPGSYVNYALKTLKLDGLLKLIEGEQRECEFRDCLAYYAGSTEPQCFTGRVRGTLANKPQGTMQEHLWSELGLIFIPEGSEKTLAEMSHDEYQEWRKLSREKSSPHRLFAEWFLSR